MADVCIFYSRKNRSIAEKLYQALSESWNVWWDDKIAGNYDEAIEREVPQAKCVIPIWSRDAHASNLVRDELEIARANNIVCIPVMLDKTPAPYGHRRASSVNLEDWDGIAEHRGLQQLLGKIATVVPPRHTPTKLALKRNSDLRLPAIFMSVSSHETQLAPLGAVEALRVFQVPTMLVSAYDLLPSRRSSGIQKSMRSFRRQKGLLLLDSGNYESTRREDVTWTVDAFHKVLGEAPCDLAFCFDVMKPASKIDRAVAQVVKAVRRDQAASKSPVLPIVHCDVGRPWDEASDWLPQVVRGVAEQLQPALIAVAERELGPGIIARTKMVLKIREALNRLPFYQPLHILGTGNPWTIALLAAAGADSFDGLEWCRFVVDREHQRLNHLQHFDFFRYQAELADSLVTTTAIIDPNIDYAGRVAFHNLDYYAELLKSLQDAATRNTHEAHVVGLLGSSAFRQLKKEIPELFT